MKRGEEGLAEEESNEGKPKRQESNKVIQGATVGAQRKEETHYPVLSPPATPSLIINEEKLHDMIGGGTGNNARTITVPTSTSAPRKQIL